MLDSTENHIFFFQTSWKDGLSIKIALEFDLSCIIGKDDISFFQKYDLTPRRKMKDDLSQKKIHGMSYFLQMFWKDGLKRWFDRAGTWFFCYSLERWYFFSRKHSIFSLDGKRGKDDPSQEIHGNMIFSIWYVPRPLAKEKKNQRWSYPAKIHLKVIDMTDRHPRTGSSNSLYLHGDLYRRSHTLLSSKKNGKLNI